MPKTNRAQTWCKPRHDGTVFGVAFSRTEALAPARRYTAERKRQIVDAVRRGVVSREEVCAAHAMSDDELFAWVAACLPKDPSPSWPWLRP